MSLADQKSDPWEHTSGFASSNIDAFRYDKTLDILQVDFTDGSSYEYQNVQPATHRAFQTAPSKGGFFARHVKGRFSYERV